MREVDNATFKTQQSFAAGSRQQAAGTLEFKGLEDADLMDQLKTKYDYMEEEDEDGWRLVAGEEYGSVEAQAKAKCWLSAEALQRLQNEDNEGAHEAQQVHPQPASIRKPCKQPKQGKV